ncbi:SMC-Scp complex subunit ScpB [Aliikangiella sp. G2MR2-5]|uniref:SMC-Scp complex subunit ScpB n=1 Tax=Aliikangiella sp. G2MR2-5 TaxID=2788943 RepID=UPI0018AC48DD|nr:SMC-Scp complex subunit ScpB [Aliikangiella sp. G2MR2-5]
MQIDDNKLKNILEAALMAVGKPMSMEQLMKLFTDEERPSASRVKDALEQLQQDCEGRGIELKEVATGYRYQARQDYSEWLSRLWEERAPKYSRAYLETLALIAYRQPVTRAEIEEVRGVSVSSNIIRAMLEREWIRVVGHRDVPGRPSLYATTKQFLDYFNMKSLEELPSLAEIRDLEDLNPELELGDPGIISSDETENRVEEGDGLEGDELEGDERNISVDSLESEEPELEQNESEEFESDEQDTFDLSENSAVNEDFESEVTQDFIESSLSSVENSDLNDVESDLSGFESESANEINNHTANPDNSVESLTVSLEQSESASNEMATAELSDNGENSESSMVEESIEEMLHSNMDEGQAEPSTVEAGEDSEQARER